MKKYSITFEVVLADENIHPDSVARVMDMALADFADPTVARWQYMGATEIDAQPSVTDRAIGGPT